LAFGRKQVLETRVLRLEHTFAALEPLLERLIPENVRFDVEVTPDLDAVKVDEARLEQVLVNLISNACQAMPAGGRLKLRARNVEEADVLASDTSSVGAGPRVEILVEDSGQGMDAETRERLFEPFFTTKAFGNGTGLGLATVHGIVAQSGGHVSVQSQPGEGSRFFVYLPRSSEELAPPPVSSSPRHEPPGATVSILLVEDQPDVRAAAKRMLEHLGHRVETARDGQQALEIWANRANEFDVLISDVVMPGLDGPSLARRLRQDRPRLSVLFVSGYPESSLPLAGALTEGAAYLPKPFTLRSLSTQLAAALAMDE
jgi:two-component system cell cycle sensor histidine kinase/response regulator CckA